jgi:hypothetical protein
MATVTVADEVREIARLSDPIGIISVYVDADPEQLAGPRPAWAVELQNGVRALRDEVKQGQPHERWRAVLDRLDALEPEFERLAEPRQSGRGRALFAPVCGDEVRRLIIQSPLCTMVSLDRSAHVRPLLAALRRARPTGVITVARDQVRAVDWRHGAAEEALDVEFQEPTHEWRRLAGPANRSPATPQSSAPQQDLYDRRLEQHQARFVASVAERVAALSAERGWDRMLIAGDPRLTEPFLGALPRTEGLIVVERVEEWRSPHDLVRALAPELERADAEADLALVEEARDRAQSGRAGALGLSETLAALAEGRVDHLILDERRPLAGLRAPDGRLAAEGEVPPGVEAAELVPEPAMAERMIEAALETSAAITPVGGEAAEALGRFGGVAALLRW